MNASSTTSRWRRSAYRLGRDRRPMDLSDILRAQAGIIHRRQALAAGIGRRAIDSRARLDGGSWQRVLPEVYATFTGSLDQQQRFIAALVYAAHGGLNGSRAMLGGPSAAAVHGLSALGPPETLLPVHVLADHRSRVRPLPGVVIRRTAVMPTAWTRGGMPVAPVARAVVDTCRLLPDLRSVRALVAEAVQTGRTMTELLAAELEAGGSAGSRLTRIALAEVTAGARSAPEARVLQGIRRSSLPDPLWNTDIYAADGNWIARPDAWWREANTVLEIDSVEWHLAPERWQRTMARHEVMTAHGLFVIHATPNRVYADLAGLLQHVAQTIEIGKQRSPARVVMSRELRPLACSQAT
jgi:hypothetical protein